MGNPPLPRVAAAAQRGEVTTSDGRGLRAGSSGLRAGGQWRALYGCSSLVSAEEHALPDCLPSITSVHKRISVGFEAHPGKELEVFDSSACAPGLAPGAGPTRGLGTARARMTIS